jgi:hypothetical protein
VLIPALSAGAKFRVPWKVAAAKKNYARLTYLCSEMARKFKALRSDESGSTTRLKSLLSSLLPNRRSRKQGNVEPSNAPPSVEPARHSVSLGSKPNVIASGSHDDMWLRAEQKLRQDNGKSKILYAYERILDTELGTVFKCDGSADRHEQLCRLLSSKV